MTLVGIVLAVVGADRAAAEGIASPLRDAGATVSTAVAHLDALATLSASVFDAVIVGVGGDPEGFVPFAESLRLDERTRLTPLIGVVDDELTVARVAPLRLSRTVMASRPGDLLDAVQPAAEARRLAEVAATTSRDLEERLRVALDRLGAVRADSQALTHDARVLCGIVIGFAANLRDGIAGPLTDLQRSHVHQIIEAANDTAAMLERFGGDIRAQATLPSEPSAAAQEGRRPKRRMLLDLSELARGTVEAFAPVARQKRLTLVAEAPAPVSVWGDGLQLKQVTVNLLVNALKFTPSGGTVTLSVRQAAPHDAPAGVAARVHAEIAVRDTGRGIPPEERERIFERGVRLPRDANVPGNGLGLAVAREIVKTHGGSIRAEETEGGGAALVVTLPVDLRARRQAGVLFVDDAVAARRVLGLLREMVERSADAPFDIAHDVAKAIEHCRAVVVVGRAAAAALSDLAASRRTAEAASE